MNVRPLFWMMVGAGATLVGGAWGGRQFLPVQGEPQQNDLAKNAVQLEASVKPSSIYTAENSLRRTPWVKPKADPFGERPVVVPRAVAPVVVIHEPPPLVFPFVYVGKLIADGKETLYLTKGDQIYPVAEGATLEGLYRVDHIGSDSIELSYIPDARKMTFSLGSITAKQVPSAATLPPRSVVGSIAQPPANYFGGERATQPETVLAPTEGDALQTMATSPSLPENEVLQQMMAPPPISQDGLQQNAASAMPAGMMPPGMFPPGMFPPGMFPPGALPPGVLPPGVDPSGIMPPGVPK